MKVIDDSDFIVIPGSPRIIHPSGKTVLQYRLTVPSESRFGVLERAPQPQEITKPIASILRITPG